MNVWKNECKYVLPLRPTTSHTIMLTLCVCLHIIEMYEKQAVNVCHYKAEPGCCCSDDRERVQRNLAQTGE